MNKNKLVKLETSFNDKAIGGLEAEDVTQEIALKPKKLILGRIFIVSSVLVLLGIMTYGYLNYYEDNQNQNLGTYDDPEVAFRETQKALSILSTHLKIGIESVQYIEEYDNSKKIIFKQQ
jgi:hypothetical protein